MSTYSNYAVLKMRDLVVNHQHEVGRELKKAYPEKYKDLQATDCITYVLNVLSHGFRQVGDDGSAKEVWKYGERGVDLAKYLVTDHSWRGIYINPDVAHPRDGDSEHSYTSFLARKKCQYYGIPLKYRVENYLVTSASDDAFQKLNKNTHQSVLNTIDIKSLEKVDFGFGLSRGGMHTWLFSKGSVYEVHWDKIGAELYEVSPLRRYPWLSGAIVIPPLQSSLLSANSKLACSAQ